MRWGRSALAVWLVGGLLAACAVFTVDQRSSEGPTAAEVWRERFRAVNGRAPTFAEERRFEEDMDGRVRAFLAEHPEVASSFQVGNLRLFRQVAVGMTKTEVRLLLDHPLETTADPGRMAALAGRFWPLVGARAREAWTYPTGWTLYFDGNTLVDVTRYHRAFLHP